MSESIETAIVGGAPDEPGGSGARPGARLGPWELVRPLQSGGMGEVWLGRRADDVYQQTVAIKLIRSGHLAGDTALGRQLIARFESERQILARMNHPNVARILDGGTTPDGHPFLVMEFVDGAPLTEYAKREKLDVPARIALFAKVCDGVQEAHRHLVVHRDLKPDNILVAADGEPRLLDFGIAKPLQTDGGDAQHTGLSAMTPAYASPEQVRNEPIGTGSDVYSLGVVLYQLLAEVRPYELSGLRPAEAERVVCEQRHESMRLRLEQAALGEAEKRRRRAQLTPDIERIVEKAMHQDVARRYGSAQALAEDLRRYLAGQPVQAMPDSAGYRVRRFVGRNRIGTTIAAIALTAVLAASVVAILQARRAQQAAADTASINAFLLDVLRASDPFTTGAELTLAEAVDSAAAAIDVRFAGRPDLAARVRHSLGYSLLSRARLDAAEPLLLRAREDSLAAFGPDGNMTLQIDEALAQLRLEQGDTEAAGAGWRSVIARLEAQALRSVPLYRTAINNLGSMYLRQEKYDEALPWFERALALPIAEADADGRQARIDRATAQANLAQARHGLGDLDAADATYADAQAALEALYPQGHPDLAIVLNNRAQLADERGDLEGAYALQTRSLAMREQALGGRDHPLLVKAMTGLAQTALRLDRTEEGLAIAERAEAMAMRVYPQPHRDRVFAHFVHGAALINSRRFVEAGEAVVRAEETFAALAEKPEDLAVTVPGIRHALCMRPRDPPVPSCAGIEPTEPPLDD